MNEKEEIKIPKYFAAANTYAGFKSYFDRVFPSGEYERIYVLKGGPGTGKSSFMRRVSAVFVEKDCLVEEIYCSSDPHSLDGVIISKNNKKIAVLDGTAPHERDAKIPGAIDELVNLGFGWDGRWLAAKKEEILSISNEKSSAYNTAYSYLSLAGKSSDIIKAVYKSGFNKSKAKSAAERILGNISNSSRASVSTRLISSFGRYGEHRLNTFSELGIRVIRIGGDELASGLFLNCCIDLLMAAGVGFIHLPSALDPSLTDGIYLPEAGLAIIRDESGEINADEFVSLPPLDGERIKKARGLHSDALDEAKRWFAIASDLHFRLEKIYGEAMNFEINERILQTKIEEIGNILEKGT